jgi:hypothetical protein
MKWKVRGKKRELRNKSVPINHPGRGQYIVESMRGGRCPDCQTKLIESTDRELIEFNDNMAKAFECPKCHWQGVLGG